MNRFTTKYADRLVGTLSGFDRLVFRGTLRRLSFVEGLRGYLSARRVLLKEFGDYSEALTEKVKAAFAALTVAEWGYVTALAVEAFRQHGAIVVGLVGFRLFFAALGSFFTISFIERQAAPVILAMVAGGRVLTVSGAISSST